MEIIEIIFLVLIALAAVALTYAVLRQSSKAQGLSGAISGGSSDTYYGQGKGKDKEKTWNKVTIILAIFFVVVVLAFYIWQPTKSKVDIGDPDAEFTNPEETTTVAPSTTETPATTDIPVTTVAPTTTTAPANDETPNE
ncbi:MAG: preprotein translocase subunit SecG [Clostridia bacterium]|nr:preprotein translocase subunit SecG [Clostridia bacterium]